jgi:hypothetical protein
MKMCLVQLFKKRFAVSIGSPESAKAGFEAGRQTLLEARKLIDTYRLRFDSSFRNAKNNPLKIELASISSAKYLLNEIEPVHGRILDLDSAIRANYVSANQIGLGRHRNQLLSELGDVLGALLHYYLAIMNSATRMMKALYHSKHADPEQVHQMKAIVQRAYNVTKALYDNTAFRYAYDKIPDIKKRYDELVEWEGRVIDGAKQDFP